MSFTRVTRHIGRTANPWFVALSVLPVKMRPTGTTLKAELRFGRAVLDAIGVKLGGFVALGIGRDEDAGRFELTQGDRNDRVVATNGKASFRVYFPGSAVTDEPWPSVRLEIVEAKRGRVVVQIPSKRGNRP